MGSRCRMPPLTIAPLASLTRGPKKSCAQHHDGWNTCHPDAAHPWCSGTKQRIEVLVSTVLRRRPFPSPPRAATPTPHLGSSIQEMDPPSEASLPQLHC